MKILYVTHKPIYPKVDGGCVAMDNFLRMLTASKHSVKHITVSTVKHPFDELNYPAELRKLVSPEAVEVDTRIKSFQALLALFSKKSYNVRRFESVEMRKRITDLLHEQSYDCVILESLYTSVFLEDIRCAFKGKVYLRTHNVEFHIWKNLATNCQHFLKRLYLTKLSKDLKRYELRILNAVDGIISISRDDTSTFQSLGVKTQITTISLGFSIEETHSNNYTGANFFHLGALNWEPNREAVDRLVELFPKIKEVIPDTQLHIIGDGSEKLAVTENNIHLDGFVTDLASHCQSIGILVTPITSGSGIRIKILEMMALGIPVITTIIGAQGIDYSSTDCLVIADTNEDIVTACKQLATSEKLRKTIGTQARTYISEHHQFETNRKQLNEFIERN